MALATMPKIRQVLVVDASNAERRRWSGGSIWRGKQFERRTSAAT